MQVAERLAERSAQLRQVPLNATPGAQKSQMRLKASSAKGTCASGASRSLAKDQRRFVLNEALAKALDIGHSLALPLNADTYLANSGV
jgi:hypothetical protein